MGKENIEKYSSRYALLKAFAGFWHNNVFYRKVIVLGRDNINPDHHLIFAPNHQNALMDALAVLFTQKGQMVFLARADIFRKKFIASILYVLKILPVYRMRDGYANLKGNDEIFAKTIDVLRNKNGLVVLPEGSHEGFRRLRQLKKGICRIAFQADEASGFEMNIKIIPVGIEFSHYFRYRQVLTVVYGKPVEVSEFHELYKNSPEIALNKLREKLSGEIKRLMVHIDSEEDYEAIDELRSIVNGRYSDRIRIPKLFRDRILIEKLNHLRSVNLPLYDQICSLSLIIKQKSKALKVDYRMLRKKRQPLLLLLAAATGIIISLPVFIFGNIFNLPILEIPNLQFRKTKDEQFRSTLKYGVSLAMAFILIPVFLVVSFLLFSPWWLAILIFLALPLSGLFAWYLYLLLRRIIGGFRIRYYIRNKNKEFFTLRENHDQLIRIVSGL
jgi:1-acyl-sn-glycerol-3-phosphate acyltransferase